ncbi:MAG: TonB-dependent receptor [Gammaproteobacteria bacterium]|nr:TonB-dependent receptor [Gammaproteobacteria bacterium]
MSIDGVTLVPGGPNWMDPPMHYAPPIVLSRIDVDRGLSPVSEGPGLAGGAHAVFKRVDFSATPEFAAAYDLSAQVQSVNDSYNIGGVAGVANDRWRINVIGSYDKGQNSSFAGGEIAASGFERSLYGISGGYAAGNQEFGVDYRHYDTDATGNPPFAMDIEFFNTDMLHATHRISLTAVELETSASYTEVKHAMNNYTLRPAPTDMTRWRRAEAGTRTVAAGFKLHIGADDSRISVGGDVQRGESDVWIRNPNNVAFYLNSLPDISTRRWGVFGQLNQELGVWRAEIGTRIDFHDMRSDMASVGAAVPAGPRMLMTAFNSGVRDWDDTTVDILARVFSTADAPLRWRMTLGRKQRVPTHVERFAWLPTEASAGLADGNTYVGQHDLAAETAYVAEAGFDWAGARAYARPTVFYRRIDDYIQGIAFDTTPGVVDSMVEMVSAMNGDFTPLRFANVDARLYGFDMDFGLQIADRWLLDGIFTYVRGRRTDVEDNLYRVTPTRLRLGSTYDAERWAVTLEGILSAAQRKVSATNGERETGGYGVLNLYASWSPNQRLSLVGGVENLLDKRYSEHLAGYNRVTGSDVAVGARLPGAGRGVFLRLNLTSD